MKKLRFNVYSYPLKLKNGVVYYGSYTIKKGVSPLKFKGEKLTSTFTAIVKE